MQCRVLRRFSFRPLRRGACDALQLGGVVDETGAREPLRYLAQNRSVRAIQRDGARWTTARNIALWPDLREPLSGPHSLCSELDACAVIPSAQQILHGGLHKPHAAHRLVRAPTKAGRVRRKTALQQASEYGSLAGRKLLHAESFVELHPEGSARIDRMALPAILKASIVAAPRSVPISMTPTIPFSATRRSWRILSSASRSPLRYARCSFVMSFLSSFNFARGFCTGCKGHGHRCGKLSCPRK